MKKEMASGKSRPRRHLDDLIFRIKENETLDEIERKGMVLVI